MELRYRELQNIQVLLLPQLFSPKVVFKYYVSKFPQIWDPPPPFISIGSTSLALLDDCYNTFQIIKICFSIIMRIISCDVGAVFKEIST